MNVVPKTPLPVRQTRSSRNRKLAESVKKEGEKGLDLMKSEDKENEVKEEKTQPRTRSTRNREKSKDNSSQVCQVFPISVFSRYLQQIISRYLQQMSIFYFDPV